MVLTNFKPLELPQSLPITANATHRNVGADGGSRPVVMRSTRPSILHHERRDLVRCAQDFDIDSAAPPSERLIIQYYIDEGSLGKLSTSGGKLSAIDNPNKKMALHRSCSRGQEGLRAPGRGDIKNGAFNGLSRLFSRSLTL